MHTHSCMHAHKHTHTHMQKCTYTHTQPHACLHAHTHTHTNKHTHPSLTKCTQSQEVLQSSHSFSSPELSANFCRILRSHSSGLLKITVSLLHLSFPSVASSRLLISSVRCSSTCPSGSHFPLPHHVISSAKAFDNPTLYLHTI